MNEIEFISEVRRIMKKGSREQQNTKLYALIKKSELDAWTRGYNQGKDDPDFVKDSDEQ